MNLVGTASGLQAGEKPRALSPERLAKLELDQVRIAEANVQPALYAMPVFALIIGFMLSAWVPANDLFFWVIAVCAGSIRYFAGQYFLELKDPSPSTVRAWHHGLAVSTFVANIIWMYPQFGFYWECSETGQMLLALVAGCSLAGGVAMLAPSAYLVLAALSSFSLGIILPPLMHGDALHLGVGMLGIGLSLFMAHVAWTTHRSARDLFLTREDKNELIEQLAAAKFDSDKARQRAEAASLAKSEFLANMSHELRTPLNAILGFSDIMRGEVFGSLGSPQYVEYSNDIHESGQHLLGLINDVLDLAKIEAGRFTVRAVEIGPREAIASALKFFEVPAAQARIDFRTDIDKDLPLLLADERALHQVLLNIISNAVKFTPAGGTVTVFAKRAANGGMDVGVSDTGVGIDPSDLNSVFEAFGQGRHDIASSDRGTGLGLPIVRGLIEAHGGKVRLESELGRGTTVICWFPRERLTAPQPVPIRLAAVI
jgi:two-component system cell cycle sensor histidine kinase PleC